MEQIVNKILNGVDATVTAQIGDRIEELDLLVSLEASVEVSEEDIKILNHRATFKKKTGWNGTGTLTIRYGHNVFRDMMYEYVQTGKMPKLQIVTINESRDGDTKPVKTRLGGISINKIDVSKVDINSSILETEVPFSFSEWEEL